MKDIISNVLRKYVAAIEGDDTPTDEELAARRRPRNVDYGGVTEHQYESSSKIKPSRAKAGTPPKFDDKDTRREYQKQYRAEGRDVETGNQYVKKFKGE